MTHKVFIVPYDFTPVSENALQHAIATAKPVNARVYLLHVVAKHKEIEAAEAKLTEIVTKFKVRCSGRVGWRWWRGFEIRGGCINNKYPSW